MASSMELYGNFFGNKSRLDYNSQQFWCGKVGSCTLQERGQSATAPILIFKIHYNGVKRFLKLFT